MKSEPTKWRSLKYSPEYKSHKGDNRIITSRFTLLSFLPKSLIEQFRKKMNVYYLIMTILMIVLPLAGSPIAFYSTFISILSISIIKSGHEDWLKHRTDAQVNTQKMEVFDCSHQIIEIKASALQVGQVVRLSENSDVPCDLLFLAAVSFSGKALTTCEITTANLDGEPNMKVRVSPIHFPAQDLSDAKNYIQFLAKTELTIEFEEPNADLYNFNGLCHTTGKEPTPLGMENMLLRGTTIKHCLYAYGIVLYTGNETRLSLNLALKKFSKFSIIDRATNKLIGFMVLIVIILCVLAFGGYYWFENSDLLKEAWYLPSYDLRDTENHVWLGVQAALLYFVTVGQLVTIAFLSGYMETQKLVSKFFFGWDNDMKCAESGNQSVCNNSDVVDELGQIDYLLTDKTGTLTENNLKFKCCSFGGKKYKYFGDSDGKSFHLNPESQEITENAQDEEKYTFLEGIALCHTVRDVLKDNVLTYQGTSSDEEVLVTAAHNLGVSYSSKDNFQIIILSNQQKVTFRRHFVFEFDAGISEFDADRKCMSVVVEDSKNRYFLITKGAETLIIPKCISYANAEAITAANNDVSEFAKGGLRTLVIAKREISSAEFESIQSEMEHIRRNPAEASNFYNKVENNLTLLGVTGVEDMLQSNVPETLKALKKAGIRIWILTGDKLETALNIAMTCGLIHVGCSHLCHADNGFQECTTLLTNISNSDEIIERLESLKLKIGSGNSLKTLVIDGPTFEIGYKNCHKLLGQIALASPQIVYCRLTPLQKALVAKLIKHTNNSVRICAIGDGGNDVAMIQEAHVGIGILGREGRQAARAADFAIPKFEHIQKSILVHGNWNYSRLAMVVMYITYRAIPMCLPQFLYGIDSGFSAMALFAPEIQPLFAMVFSAYPLVFYGLTEKKYSAEKLLQNPEFYNKNRGNRLMSPKWTIYWIGTGLWHSVLIMYLPRLIWVDIHCFDWALYSHFMNALLMTATDFKLMMSTRTFSWLTLVGQVLSFGLMILVYTLMSEIFGIGMLQYAYFPLLSRMDFWFVTFLITFLSLIPDLPIILFKTIYGNKTRRIYLS